MFFCENKAIKIKPNVHVGWYWNTTKVLFLVLNITKTLTKNCFNVQENSNTYYKSDIEFNNCIIIQISCLRKTKSTN